MKRVILISIPVVLLAGLYFVRRWQNPDANTWLQRQANNAYELRINTDGWDERIGLSTEWDFEKAVIITDNTKIQKLIGKLECSGPLSQQLTPSDMAKYHRTTNLRDEGTDSLNIEFDKMKSNEYLTVEHLGKEFWMERTHYDAAGEITYTTRGLAKVESRSVTRFLNELRRLVQESRANPKGEVKILREEISAT